jgi:cytochrome d ubiquinol oxidase subunit I
MLLTVASGLILMRKKQLDEARWYLRCCQFAPCFGFIAVIAGWTTTEVGRQPWTIYGLLRTADSVSPSLTGFDVSISLVLYIAVYLLIYPTGLYLMLKIVRSGPSRIEDPSPVEAGHPKGPVEALPATQSGAT